MSYADRQFLFNCKTILNHGYSDEKFDVRAHWEDGTPAHTLKILHSVDYYHLSKNIIPVLTIRKTNLKNAVDELLWIYQKKSNKISDLHSHIWDSWDIGNGTIGLAYGYQIGLESKHHIYHKGENLDGIHYSIHQDTDGKDWVWMSQIDAVIWDLKNNPGSRSIILNTYNHRDLADMGLRPCAYMMTFNVTQNNDGKLVLNGLLNQRSQDMLTANNWNVVQYSVLIQMLAQVTGMIPGKFTHMVADMHLYDRHIPIVREAFIDNDELQTYDNPIFVMNDAINNFYDFKVEDFSLENYKYNPFNYKIEVAI